MFCACVGLCVSLRVRACIFSFEVESPCCVCFFSSACSTVPLVAYIHTYRFIDLWQPRAELHIHNSCIQSLPISNVNDWNCLCLLLNSVVVRTAAITAFAVRPTRLPLSVFVQHFIFRWNAINCDRWCCQSGFKQQNVQNIDWVLSFLMLAYFDNL